MGYKYTPETRRTIEDLHCKTNVRFHNRAAIVHANSNWHLRQHHRRQERNRRLLGYEEYLRDTQVTPNAGKGESLRCEPASGSSQVSKREQTPAGSNSHA